MLRIPIIIIGNRIGDQSSNKNACIDSCLSQEH